MSVDDDRHSIEINLNADKTKATLHIDEKIYTYDVKAENGNELNVCDYVVYNDASEYLADEFQLLDLRLASKIQKIQKKFQEQIQTKILLSKNKNKEALLSLMKNYLESIFQNLKRNCFSNVK